MKVIILFTSIASLLFACRSSEHKAVADNTQTAEVADIQLAEKKEENNKAKAIEDAKPSIPYVQAATDTTAGPVLQAGQPAVPDWDKKIIKTAKITLELKDYQTYNQGLHQKLKTYGAYIAQENQEENDYRIQNVMEIKVPVEQFDQLLNGLGGDGIKLLEKNISSEDVTGEVVDTKARIEAKKQVRARYIELLKQAKNMEEILQVQNEINSIQENLEAASGRVNYLQHASAYSTVHLRFYQFTNGATEKDLKPGLITRITEGFKTGGEMVLELFVWVISVWPVIVGALLLYAYFRKKKQTRMNVKTNIG